MVRKRVCCFCPFGAMGRVFFINSCRHACDNFFFFVYYFYSFFFFFAFFFCFFFFFFACLFGCACPFLINSRCNCRNAQCRQIFSH